MKNYLFIFDMGNVIVNNCAVFEDVVKSLGFKEISETQKRDMMNVFAAATRGNITSMESLEITARREGLPAPCENFWLKFFKPEMIEDSLKFVEAIKKQGYRVVCGTNTIDVHYNYHIEHKEYGIFDKVYASNLMGQMKPDATFWMAIKEAEKSYSYDKMFFFDDMEENVRAAESLGINAHVFTTAQDAAEYVKKICGLEIKF